MTAPYPAGTALVVVRRLRFADGLPAGLQRSALPAASPTSARRRRPPPDASLYALLEAGGVMLNRSLR